ncbi:hypothetical protein E4U23_004885 [Claviceps purpurea]|nr:hypothetical protein E4U23_004885 [Claviceps purpurea]
MHEPAFDFEYEYIQGIERIERYRTGSYHRTHDSLGQLRKRVQEPRRDKETWTLDEVELDALHRLLRCMPALGTE